MTGSLEGKTAIIAGAGGGVGRAIAQRFARAGARLMLADTDDAGLDETMSGIEAGPEAIASFTHAIEDKLGVTNLIAATIDQFKRIDILITCAHTSAPGGLSDLTASDFGAMLSGTIGAVFLQTKLVARRMIQQRAAEAEPGETSGTAIAAGAIVNISSIAARRTAPDLLAPSVSAAALDQLTRSAAASLAAHGIRVNAVALDVVMTADLRAAMREHEELRDEIIAVTPMGRIGEAEEAAEAALFLASPSASFITGQIVAIDGGRLLLDPLAVPLG
jgi:7-alpha-hydroxysteroid dehydrogenase